MALNDLGVVNYLQICWDMVMRRLTCAKISHFSYVHLGRSHIVKDISSWKATKNSSVRQVKRTWKVVLCQLINVSTVEELDHVWDMVFGILGCANAHDAAPHRLSLQKRIRGTCGVISVWVENKTVSYVF
jgi:hypothetical protein